MVNPNPDEAIQLKRKQHFLLFFSSSCLCSSSIIDDVTDSQLPVHGQPLWTVVAPIVYQWFKTTLSVSLDTTQPTSLVFFFVMVFVLQGKCLCREITAVNEQLYGAMLSRQFESEPNQIKVWKFLGFSAPIELKLPWCKIAPRRPLSPHLCATE